MTDTCSLAEPKPAEAGQSPLKCRVCGCTDYDCRGCIEKTGHPCYWVEADLCSACVPEEKFIPF
jgi:hypothetical protein